MSHGLSAIAELLVALDNMKDSKILATQLLYHDPLCFCLVTASPLLSKCHSKRMHAAVKLTRKNVTVSVGLADGFCIYVNAS